MIRISTRFATRRLALASARANGTPRTTQTTSVDSDKARVTPRADQVRPLDSIFS